MTAYIDNIIIQGTPEEIQEFIKLHKNEGATVPGGWTFQNGVIFCEKCRTYPCHCASAIPQFQQSS